MASSIVWFAVAVLAAGCAGSDRKEASNKTGEVSSVPVNPPASNGANAPGTVRFEQGTNNPLAGLEVGVMNVWKEDDGSLVVQIAINDPATSKSERSEHQRGETITVGTKKFRVVDITPTKGNDRAAVTLAPVE
jgi:hypothetical protein